MAKSYQKTFAMRGMKVLYAVLRTTVFMACWLFFYAKNIEYSHISRINLLVGCLYFIITALLDRVYKAFDVGTSRVSELVYSQSLTNIVAAGVFYLLFSIFRGKFINPLPLLLMLVYQLIGSLIWCKWANKIYFSLNQPKKTVVIYRQASDLYKLKEVNHFSSKFDVQKQIENPKEDLQRLLKEINDYEAIFISGISLKLRNGITKHCIEKDIPCYILPHVGDVVMASAKHMQMFSVPIMRVSRASPPIEFLITKRAFDVLASLAGIAIASPIMLLTALAIKAYDRGPVIYKQVRLTKNGKKFFVLKFRSMVVHAEKDGIACMATQNDCRITPVGKLIRATRMDELPQLFNVLKGEMSIVGPRPERPEIAQQYAKTMPAFSLRLQVKAGLTGLAQVYGKYNTPPYDKLKMDLLYINKMSVAEDLRLIFATIKILFMPESTEGVSEGQTTAMSVENH